MISYNNMCCNGDDADLAPYPASWRKRMTCERQRLRRLRSANKRSVSEPAMRSDDDVLRLEGSNREERPRALLRMCVLHNHGALILYLVHCDWHAFIRP